MCPGLSAGQSCASPRPGLEDCGPRRPQTAVSVPCPEMRAGALRGLGACWSAGKDQQSGRDPAGLRQSEGRGAALTDTQTGHDGDTRGAGGLGQAILLLREPRGSWRAAQTGDAADTLSLFCRCVLACVPA